MSNVEHPQHYNCHPSGIECIEIVRHMDFNLGNVLKYIWRHGKTRSETSPDELSNAIDDLEMLKCLYEKKETLHQER